jgi:hypothetical protein
MITGIDKDQQVRERGREEKKDPLSGLKKARRKTRCVWEKRKESIEWEKEKEGSSYRRNDNNNKLGTKGDDMMSLL